MASNEQVSSSALPEQQHQQHDIGHSTHPQLNSGGIDGSQSSEEQISHNNDSSDINEDHPKLQRRDMKLRRPSSPNASSAPITQADGAYTDGIVNRHPNAEALHDEFSGADAGSASGGAAGGSGEAGSSGAADLVGFRVGVSEDSNTKCRRTMEDSHAFVYDFGGVKGQGYFAVFDGHAGKHAAEWCGANFHKYLLDQLREGQDTHPIPDLLNATFHIVDSELSKLSAEEGSHSGCTAVTAFLRLEDENGNAVQLDQDPDSSVGSRIVRGGAGDHGQQQSALADGQDDSTKASAMTDGDGQAVGDDLRQHMSPTTPGEAEDERKRKFGDGIHRERFKSLFSSSGNNNNNGSGSGSGSGSSGNAGTPYSEPKKHTSISGTSTEQEKAAAGIIKPARAKNLAKRTLYTANVGDARAVLSRGGKAVRLTYDHKGSDAQEAKRITDAGGFVMNNRVNGVLAVTRSLGDSSMKEFVVGSPYTTETTLGDEDDFLIVACDGLWDVCEDQTAVDLIRNCKDPQEASQILLDHALSNFSTDNLSVLVVSLQTGY